MGRADATLLSGLDATGECGLLHREGEHRRPAVVGTAVHGLREEESKRQEAA